MSQQTFYSHLPLYVSVFVLVLTMIGTIWVLLVWHKDKDVDFDLREAIVDSVTGKIAIEKVFATGAFIVSSWGFITEILTEKFNIEYLTIYIGTFGALRAVSQGLAVLKDIKTPDGSLFGRRFKI